MARSVTIVAGYNNVELPNGISYNATHAATTNGPTVILTDDEGAHLNIGSAAFVDNGTVGTNITGISEAANVAAPSAQTSVAVTTTAATSTTPYGYAGATQANAVATTINALVADVAALYTTLNAELTALKAGSNPVQKSS